ncbi:hypothetical protein P9112_011790 [Eukaryota sp. TZLM1-RC]
MRNVVLLVLACVAIAAAQPYMKLKVGHTFQYRLTAKVELGSTSASGHGSNFGGVFVVKVTKVKGAESNAVYTLTANIEGVSQDGSHADGKHIGSPIVFDWSAVGHISNIRADSRDQSWQKEVKLAALNSLSGTLVPAGKNVRIKESSTLGQHYSNYKGSQQPDLLVNKKNFKSEDVISFSDKSLNPKQVTLQANGYSKFHTAGHLHETELDMNVLWRPVESPQIKDQFDSDMKSRGFVRLAFLTHHAANGVLLMKDDSVNDSLMSLQAPVLAEPEPEHHIHYDSLLDAAVHHVEIGMDDDAEEEVEESPLEIIKMLFEGSEKEDLTVLQQVVDLSIAIYPSFTDIFHEISLLASAHNPELTQAVAFVLTAASSEQPAASIAINNLLKSESTAVGYLVARTAIHSTCSMVDQALFERSMVPDVVGSYIRYSWVPETNNLGRKILDFNKEWSYTKRFGGKIAAADMGVHIGASSNLNCKNPTFDYEAYARSHVDLSLFGQRKNAVKAFAEYGKKGGVPLANAAHVEVFGKTIYHKDFPTAQLDCGIHTIPVKHFAPGAKYSTVIWVLVPIKLSAGANLNLKLDLGWRVCDTDLSAMVQAIPAAGLTVYGKAEVNLFLIKAGAKMDAKFSIRAVPQAEASGTKCAITLSVDLINDPLNVDLKVYVKKKSCKVKFPFKFKCKWKNKKNKSLLHWAHGAKTQRVYEKVFRIAK